MEQGDEIIFLYKKELVIGTLKEVTYRSDYDEDYDLLLIKSDEYWYEIARCDVFGIDSMLKIKNKI